MLRLQPFCLNWGTFCKYFKSNTGAVLAASQSPGCSSHRLVSVPAAGQPLVWTSKTIKRLKNRPRECVHGHLQEWGALPACLLAAEALQISSKYNHLLIKYAADVPQPTRAWMDGQTDGWMGSGCTASLLSEHSVFLLVPTRHCGSHNFQTRPCAFLALL